MMNRYPLPRPSHICIFADWDDGFIYADWYPLDARDSIYKINEATVCNTCGDPVYRMPAVAVFVATTVGNTYEWRCAKCYNFYDPISGNLPEFSSGNIPTMDINVLSEDELLDLYCALFHLDINGNNLIPVLNRLNSIRKL